MEVHLILSSLHIKKTCFRHMHGYKSKTLVDEIGGHAPVVTKLSCIQGIIPQYRLSYILLLGSTGPSMNVRDKRFHLRMIANHAVNLGLTSPIILVFRALLFTRCHPLRPHATCCHRRLLWANMTWFYE
jgi:hypothetical protein